MVWCSVLPKCNILAVHPGGGVESDVELGVVCVATVISHAQDSRAGVRDCIALICRGRGYNSVCDN